ncbi:MAG: tetratricopeptide repeat protein [Candidatus Obscuribacter sp.]|nr:tetratricopeptide repeat protein [Candidatus Obscuribacter sp.]
MSAKKLGQCYGDCAQYSKAIDTLEQVKKILREHNALAKVQAYNIACLAYCKIKDNRATEALSDLNVCLQIAKDNQDLLKQRAYAYLKLKNYDASLTDYDKLIKLDPANPQLFVERAEANEAKANFDDALSDIEQAIELKPLSFDYRMTRARILVESQKDKLALQAFSELINDYPDYIDLLIRRAQFYNYKKDYAHAIADYTSYIDKAQSKPKAGNETDTGNTPTASANLVQKSYLADVYLERATAYEHQGQKSEAATDRKKAAQLKAPAKAAN